MKKRTKLTLATTLLGFACTFGTAGHLAAQEADSSSACINCHTDFEQMDSYGASGAGGAAAIAG